MKFDVPVKGGSTRVKVDLQGAVVFRNSVEFLYIAIPMKKYIRWQPIVEWKMRHLVRIVGVVVIVAGIASYYLGSFTIIGWIGIFMVAAGIILIVRPLKT